MNLMTAIFGQNVWATNKPASMINTSPGYFWATQDYVERKGILEPFLSRARQRKDLAREVNDKLLATEYTGLRSFLVQRKSNAVEVIHAEFLLLRIEDGSISGPVATSANPNKEEVRAKHMVMVARLCGSAEFKKGEHYAFTVPNNWGADRALREFGFDTVASVDVQIKAHLFNMIDGVDATLSVQSKPTVPASIEQPRTRWWLKDFELEGDAGFGPHGKIRLKRHNKV